MDSCHHCKTALDHTDDLTKIVRFGYFFTFHTECFKEVAGSEYVPKIPADTATDFSSSMTIEELRSAYSPPASNSPTAGGITINTEQELLVAVNDVCQTISSHLRTSGLPPASDRTIKTAIEAYFGNRHPLGVQIHVEVSSSMWDPHTKEVTVIWEGAQRFYARTKLIQPSYYIP
jgi:hypothetical protein